MSLSTFTTQEKLIEMDAMIDALRKIAISQDDYRRLRIIRSVAADLRGRLECAPSVALAEIERRITFAYRNKTRSGYDRDALIGLGEELIGRWPLIKQALEKFGAEQ